MRVARDGRPLLKWLCLATAISLVGLSYWLFLRPGSSPTDTKLLRRIQNRENTCLDDILLAFSIEELSLSLPIYMTLSHAEPVSETCLRAIADSRGPGGNATPPAGFSKPELLSEAERDRIYGIVQQLHTNFSRLGLELFLEGGSLLGSVRHLGFIPWDEDVDLMIPISQKPAALQLLVNMSSSNEYRFVNTEKTNQHWKLGILCQVVRNKAPRRMYGTNRLYPEKECKTFVDFFFGRVENRQYKRMEAPNSLPVHHVYPLTLRPFGSRLLPVPNKPELFLAAVYGQNYESKCLFKYFKHRMLYCSSLSSLYPFVKHMSLPYNGRVLRLDLLVQNSKMMALFIPEQ